MSLTVLLTDSDLGDRDLDVRRLEDALGAQVVVATCRTEADVLAEVTEHQPDAIVTQWAPITDSVLAAAPRCRVISRVGIGIDMIDVDAARARGVDVRNVPHYCTEEVATHTVALAMSLWRKLPSLDAEVRSGVWAAAASASDIPRLSASTIGLVGLGRIGLMVARAFEVWGATVIAVDPIPGADPYERVSMDVLAERADLISLHAPLTADTHHLVDDAFLDRTRRRPLLINASRGGLVDIDAVSRALADGRLRGAGLDVFEAEPLAADAAIRQAPNAILTPHAAWCSREAFPELRRQAIENIVDFFADGRAA